MTRLLRLGAPLLAFFVVACGGPAESPEERQRRIQDLSRSVTRLHIEDVVVGTGAEASPGRVVVVHYTGTLLDGTEFDSSRRRNRPFDFTLGEGHVIAGWDEGLKGMRVGGCRILTIPSTMAYGAHGSGPAIPPHAALKFDVELLEVR